MIRIIFAFAGAVCLATAALTCFVVAVLPGDKHWTICTKQSACIFAWVVLGLLVVGQIVLPVCLTLCLKLCHCCTRRRTYDGFINTCVFSASICYQFDIWLWFILLGACYAWVPNYFNYSLALASIVLSLLCHAYVVLLESCSPSDVKYMTNTLSLTSAVQRIQQYVDASPIIEMTAVGWHYKTELRTVWFTDANGQLQSRLESYTYPVYTAPVTSSVHWSRWHNKQVPDVTDLHGITKMTKVQLHMSIDFGDSSST
jgi:hypothetical protein